MLVESIGWRVTESSLLILVKSVIPVVSRGTETLMRLLGLFMLPSKMAWRISIGSSLTNRSKVPAELR